MLEDWVFDDNDRALMRRALEQAHTAAQLGEVPVGAVVSSNGKVISFAGNRRETEHDPLGHAEIIALRNAAESRGDWRLQDCTLYVTLEPCPMCAGALVNSRVSRVVYGCDDPKAGALRTLYQIGSDNRLNHRFELIPGVLAEECASLISAFFSRIREK